MSTKALPSAKNEENFVLFQLKSKISANDEYVRKCIEFFFMDKIAFDFETTDLLGMLAESNYIHKAF